MVDDRVVRPRSTLLVLTLALGLTSPAAARSSSPDAAAQVPRLPDSALTVVERTGSVRTIWRTRTFPGGAPCWASGGAIGAVTSSDTRTTFRTHLASSRVPVARLPDSVFDVALSPDCTAVAVAGHDLPGVQSGLTVGPLGGRPVIALRSFDREWSDGGMVAWSRDGRRVAVTMFQAGIGQTLRIFDVASGAMLARVPGVKTASISAEAFSPDGSQLAYQQHPLSRDGIWIFDVARGTSRTLVDPAEGRSYGSPSWSPDGQTIAAVADWGGIELLDVRLGYGPTLATGNQSPNHLSWSPDNSMLAFWFHPEPARRGAELVSRLGLIAAQQRARPRTVTGVVATSETPLAWSPDASRIALWRDAPRRAR